MSRLEQGPLPEPVRVESKKENERKVKEYNYGRKIYEYTQILK